MNIRNIAIIIGIIALLGVGVYLGIQRTKAMSGKTTGAIVNTRYEAQETETGSRNNRRVKTENKYIITYSYTVNGFEHQRDSEIRSDIVNYERGKQGTVCYDPKNPQTSEFSLSDKNCG